MDLILKVEFISCIFLCGLIWTIQLVHYPSFSFIDPNSYPQFQKHHVSSVSFIVFPLMVIELISCLYICLNKELSTLSIISALLLLLIWLSTIFISMPIHKSLATNKNQAQIDKLVLTNWPRTIAWTLRSLILVYLSMTGGF